MSITKQLLPLSLITTLLLFTACGGGGGDTPPEDETNEPSPKTVTVPQKISIDIPVALKNERTTDVNIGKLSLDGLTADENVQSYGYQQLTSTISQAEGTIESVKENMKYLTLMMPDISKECSDTTENETCTIPEGVIKLKVEGVTLSMGEILYTKQDDNQKYQQVVVLDLKPTLEEMGATLEKDLETVEWSTDENHIETISNYADSEGKFNMHLIFDKESSGTSTMNITNSFQFASDKGTFILNIADKNDINNTVDVTMNGTFIGVFEDNILSDTYNMVGSVSNNGGYLTSTGTFLEDKFSEKETFDKDGKLLKSKFCHNFTNFENTCSLEDESTWQTFDEVHGLDSVEFNDEIFTNDVEKTLYLEINGEELETGRYTLLPQNINLIDGDVFERVREEEIASILVF